MLNLYELYKNYNFEHMIPWEAYKLENGLTVKISPASDNRYPFQVGQDFTFISHDTYTFRNGSSKESLFIYGVTPAIRDMYPEVITGLDLKGAPKRQPYMSKIVEVVPLVKVIDLYHYTSFDFQLLNFTLIGAPLFSEVLVFMMEQISALYDTVKSLDREIK